MHPHGGMSYARSYKAQKIIEQFQPETKPHVLLCGHWHVANHLPAYRNVEGFLVPSFQGQTQFARRLGLQSIVGGLILDIQYGPEGLRNLRSEWVLNRAPLADDHPVKHLTQRAVRDEK